jgi:DNA-binding MarR family transcriptional regulator
MPEKTPKELPDELFLVDVEDREAGVTVSTLRAEHSPAMLLSFAANHFIDAASRYFKNSFDLGTVDWRLLFMFAREPGCTAATASRTIGIDKGAVSRSLQRLEAVGLVTAGELHANGRSRGWKLTKQGRRLHQRILQVALARQKDVLAGFDAREVETFCGYLERFLHNLDALTGER